MAASIKVPVKTSLLVWGRESAGYNVDDAARKIGVTATKLIAAENGDDALTFIQLKNAAEVYKRPLATFFLNDAPEILNTVQDFRLNPEFTNRRLSPQLTIAIRKAKELRADVIQLAKELGDVVAAFEHQATNNENVDTVAARIRAILKIPLDAQYRWSNKAVALKEWKQSIEQQNVLVFETSRIEVDEMRGVSLPFDVFPVVLINGGDSFAGRTFTLLHEFTHLLLRQSGICDLAQEQPDMPNAQIEAFCNSVAASALVPRDALLGIIKENDQKNWSHQELSAYADAFKVSKEVILRRLLSLNLTTQAYYSAMRQEFIAEYQDIKKRKKKSTGGPEVPVMTIRNLGRPFVGYVLEAYSTDRISLSAVSSYLGIKLKHLMRLEELMHKGAKE